MLNFKSYFKMFLQKHKQFFNSRVMYRLRKIYTFKSFSLIEVSVAMIIMSLLITSLIGPVSNAMRYYRHSVTKHRVEKIRKVLGDFASMKGYLPMPCKSVNSGCEHGVLIEDPTLIHVHPKMFVGIVPYKTIGLEQNDVKDGNGKYFTYKVSPFVCRRKGYDYVGDWSPTRDDFDVGLQNCVTGFCSARFYSRDANLIARLSNNEVIIGYREKYYRYVLHRSAEESTYNVALSDLACWVNSNLMVMNQKGEDTLTPHLKNICYYVQMQLMYSNWSRRNQENDKDTRLNYAEYRVCDTVAFALISHGKNGGEVIGDHPNYHNYLIPNLKRAAIKVNCGEKAFNAMNSFEIYTHSENKDFDDEVFLISKFYFANEYMGSLCYANRWNPDYRGTGMHVRDSKSAQSCGVTSN